MSNKYYTRNQPTISRDLDSRERPGKYSDWFEEFANSLDKSGTKSKKDSNSMFDQINQILGNKSKFSNVQEAVLDMQKRTGLYDLLNKKAQEQEHNVVPEIFNDVPDMKIFIDNYVEDRPGTSIDAVVHALLKIRSIKAKLPASDDVPEDVRHYINNQIASVEFLRPDNNMNMDLGKVDLSNDDATSARDNDPFAGCMPGKAIT